MSKIVKIYCEGKKGSHDYDLIEKTLDGLVGNWQIQPIGSKLGAKRAVQVYEEKAVRSTFKLLFRDRDFDIPLPESEQLTQKDYIYFSYKTTIENYLVSI